MRIYADHNATTPTHPDVVQKMLPFYNEAYGNPSSIHSFGQQARRAVDQARREVASSVGAFEDEMIFVSGGTEANNLAIGGSVAAALRRRVGAERSQVITSAIEHPAVLEAVRELQYKGVDTHVLGVSEQGVVDPREILSTLNERTVLVSIMLANNDVGTIQPVKDIGKVVREHGILMHCDAVQALGKMPIDVDELGVDLLSLSAHKVFGPKGVGALYVRRGTEICPQVGGGGQEMRVRPGTENVPGIVGFGAACALVDRYDRENALRVRSYFEDQVRAKITGVTVNAADAPRLVNTVNLTIDRVQGASAVIGLDLAGIAVSAGPACASGLAQPSHVLSAMGKSIDEALCSLRFSFGPSTTRHDVDQIIDRLAETACSLRGVADVGSEAERFGRQKPGSPRRKGT